MNDNNLIIDQEVIKDLQQALNGKFNTMLRYFIEDSVTYMSQIKDGLKDQNPKKIISASHPLKSSSKQIGAMMLSETSEYIELKSREIQENGGNIVELITKVDELENILERTLVEYKKMLA